MISAATRRLVRQRANTRCEYCRLPEAALPYLTFHLEHIRSRQHRGSDSSSNLALACPDCNAYKGPNLSAIDPVSDQLVPVFNPRADQWDAHFEMEGPLIVGITPTGRATADLLRFNDDERLEIRDRLIDLGEW